MVEIEFLDPEESPRPLEPGRSEEIGREPGRWASLDPMFPASCLLLAGAAALALITPFQELFVIRQRGAGQTLEFAVDGWGRLHLNQDGGTPSGFHLSRFGIPLVVCAALLILLVLVLVTAALRPQLADRVVTATTVTAVAVTGALAGLLVAMWLQGEAQFSGTGASTVDVEAGPSTPTFHYGAGLWLAAAAVLAAALGAGAARRWQRR